MAFTQSLLDALITAYGSGQLRVSYEGKMMEFASGDDLFKRIKTVASALGVPSGVRSFHSTFSCFSKE
ncbi:MAG: hypothetical protein HQL37_16170 [Alphaproteobacteria bacterium]|nr:hypothetical protein [Alphaproteobacteria bacterium]